MESKLKNEQQQKIVWIRVVILGILHAAAFYGVWLIITYKSTWATWWWLWGYGITSTLGIIGGYHRLWAHKSYKANLPMRVILAAMGTMTYQNPIYEWARDHRMHHKFVETDADPHNAKRGFFFAHLGWLLVKKHSELKEKGKTIDMSDLQQDGVVMFQKKYYHPLVLLGTFIIPTLVPYYFWNENIWTSLYVATFFRYILSVNLVWCTNSVSHLYGPKPYDKTIGPTQNSTMVTIGLGGGFHNYHHCFPWDYKSSEFGNDYRCLTTYMIDAFAWLGWATELKTATSKIIQQKAERCGDGSRGFETSTAKFIK